MRSTSAPVSKSNASADEITITGTKVIAELLTARPRAFIAIELQEGAEDKIVLDILSKAKALGVSISRRPAAAKAPRISARLKPKEPTSFKELLERKATLPIILGLDGITDPQNFGAILRMAETAGVRGIFMPRDRSCPLSTTVRSVSSGASELVDVCYVNNLAAAVRELKENHYWIAGSALAENAVDLYSADLPFPICLLLGSEGSGLRRLSLELCDFVVKIPMLGVVGSLNVSQAGSVIVFELMRRFLQQEKNQ